MSDEKPPYWKAFLTHPANLRVVLGVAAVSVLASFPFGGDALALGVLALAAIEMTGLAVVPGLPNFQLWVDKGVRREQRERQRDMLLAELNSHGGSRHLNSYDQIVARVGALYRTARDRTTSLTEREVEQLDDLSLDYLRMCLSEAVMRGTEGSDFVAVVRRKIREIDQRLERGDADRDETAQLTRAKAEYDETLARRARILARRSLLEASLVAMPMRVEEMFQMVMSSPRDGNVNQLLEESVSKLKLAEEAARDVAAELEAPSVVVHPAASARRAVGQRQ